MTETPKKPHVGIIVGSNRPFRICRVIAEWVLREIQHDELNFGLIDLAEINLPFLDEPEMPANHRYRKEHTKSWSALISQYDGFVLVFPLYNWGYPAVLKNALDFLYGEWSGKPVCIMCYGTHGGTKGASAMLSVTQGCCRRLETDPPADRLVDPRRHAES
ncbi:MAG: NADPH-dependent FMN reductase [Rhodanobacteraceae bacterium]